MLNYLGYTYQEAAAEWPAECFVEELAQQGEGKLRDDWSWIGKLGQVSVEVHADDTKTKVAWLDHISTDTRGTGSAALQLIVDLADKHQVTLKLHVEGYREVNNQTLKKWYGKFGFKGSKLCLQRRPG